MRQTIMTLVVFLASLSVAFAQGNHLAIGIGGIGNLRESEKLYQNVVHVTGGRNFNPHLELRVKPLSRCSFGLSVSLPYQTDDHQYQYVAYGDTAPYWDEETQQEGIIVAPPGEGPLAWYSLRESTKVKSDFLGSFYVNFLNRKAGEKGKVQLFAAGDGGVGSLVMTYDTKTFVHPLLQPYFQYEIPSGHSSQKNVFGIFGGRLGMNYYYNHVGFSFSGGYRGNTFGGRYPVAQVEFFFFF